MSAGPKARPLNPVVPGDGTRGALPLAPPSGMRDLLLPESAARKALGRRLVETFARWGYDLVTTPPFEHAEVLERGLATLDRRDLLRFVEPDTGEVALLRPDITPQIARIVATRLRERPPPWRLCYEGTVIRQRRGRARLHRQIAQAGVECVGLRGPDADAEVIELAARACEAVGLDGYRIELRHASVARAALDPVPEQWRGAVIDALAHKDVGALEALLDEAELDDADRHRLQRLVQLYGDVGVVAEARKQLGSPRVQQALDELEEVAARLDALGLGAQLDVDLGEPRGQAYYTGVSFTLLADGPGEEVGSGGRYDNLLGQFYLPAPATGFGLDIGNLEWALARAGRPFDGDAPVRIALCDPPPRRRQPVAAALRSRRATTARLDADDESEALAFARAWGYDAVLVGAPGERLRALRMADGASRDLDPADAEQLDALLQWARGEVSAGP